MRLRVAEFQEGPNDLIVSITKWPDKMVTCIVSFNVFCEHVLR